MKNLLLLTAFFLCSLHASAQSDRYTSAMSGIIAQVDSAETIAQYQDAANAFARIASAEPKAWLPPYYAAFCYVNAAFQWYQQDPAKALESLDAAQASLEKAKTLAPDASEIAVLQAYILIGRVSENPMVKGQELSPRVFAELGKAAAINPQNPRAPFLQGTYTLNMPEFYGGGAAKAKPLFEKAAALFETAPKDALLPHWGKNANARYLAKLEKN